MNVVALGTKAETLTSLTSRLTKATIPEHVFFTVDDWRRSRDSVLQQLQGRFGDKRVAVRSSAACEDGSERSMAGAFESRLDVDASDREQLVTAIEQVIASYDSGDGDQVLVQTMVPDIAVCGVATTHVVDNGAPYYVLNYDDDSGKPDSITGGVGVHKTVLIHRDVRAHMVDSSRVRQWLDVVQEVERLAGGVPLDIEFAQSRSGAIYVLQARRITTTERWDSGIARKVYGAKRYIERFVEERSRPRPGLAGSRTILGEMTDWNPAEIIGTVPRLLASSLYRFLVTDCVWRQARASMGYRHPEGEELMVVIGGRPYIDVRNSFNSFLPGDLDEAAAELIVNAWLNRLDRHPELHDKVEFSVCHTALDFAFDETFTGWYPDLLARNDLTEFKSKLRRLTRACLDLSSSGSLARAIDAVDRLALRQRQRRESPDTDGEGWTLLIHARNLLEECVRYGTLPFAVAARHAFIAETLLRSAVQRGALTDARLSAFKQSVETVSGRLSHEFWRVVAGKASKASFLERYGHLRPGTYDILSLRYDQRPDLFSDSHVPVSNDRVRTFRPTPEEERGLERLLTEAGFEDVGPLDLLSYARRAIAAREHAKFVFTRNLSDALETLANWGGRLGLSRDELSHVPAESIFGSLSNPILEDEASHFRTLAELGRQSVELTRCLRLSYLIRGTRDLHVIPLHRGKPNFVTARRVEGETVEVRSRMSSFPDLADKIVFIENADPGFDWIFTRGMLGLVTKFGGSNSHMAVRCAELDLPAAIGCGEQTFERLVTSKRVELDCGAELVRAL